MKPTSKLLTDLKEKWNVARRMIVREIISQTDPKGEVDVSSAIELSEQILPGYSNLDWQHRAEIVDLRNKIRQYAEDKTRRRPFNIIMQAEPGSGKSHFIKCLAKLPILARDIAAITFNMAGMQGIDDLVQPLDSVRNVKVIDKTPILFLDEFDSNPTMYPLLLPLLWDGELHVGNRDLKIGKAVIVLAASGASIEKAMKSAKSFQRGDGTEVPKLSDLLSRINGGEFEIPELDEVSEERDRRVDKICIVVSLLRGRFGSDLETVPWCLLHFVAHTRFRYGVRSITHLVDLLSVSEQNQKNVNVRKLPLQTVEKLKASSLAYHIICEDGPAEVIERWRGCSEKENLVRVVEKDEELIDF